MKISKGPMIEKFAAMIDESVDVVLEWVNNYVNKPGLLEIQEPTEKERMDSIKLYILLRIENSTENRIRQSIKAERLAA